MREFSTKFIVSVIFLGCAAYEIKARVLSDIPWTGIDPAANKFAIVLGLIWLVGAVAVWSGGSMTRIFAVGSGTFVLLMHALILLTAGNEYGRIVILGAIMQAVAIYAGGLFSFEKAVPLGKGPHRI